MVYNNDVSDHEDHTQAANSGRDGPDSWAIATEQARLVAERTACEMALQQLDADLLSIATTDTAPDDATARLRRLAALDPELRTQLHIIMGNIQLLRLEPGLSPQLERRLDAMLSAGGQLLGKIHDVQQLSVTDADFSPSRIDTQRSAFEGNAGAGGLDVLVADDIEMNRDIAAALLRGAGHRVSLAEDGSAALLMATKTDFDVILMDVRMPGMDGLEATRRIRSLRGARGQVPIIALTAKVSAEEVAACRGAGMSGHLAKPFRHDTLREAVERAAAARLAETPAGAQTAFPGGPANTLSTSQLRALIAPPAAVAGHADTNGHAGSWVNIVSPWLITPEMRQHQAPASSDGPVAPSQFAVKFKRDRAGDLCNLADSMRSCAPPEGREQNEYHWLLFAEPGAAYPDSFGTECELWRWHRGSWRSVAVPGASFSPDDMYRDGWRYCGPCENAIAQVQIVEPKEEPERLKAG